MTVPRSMIAAILVEQKKPLIIDEVILPTTLDVGQVLVRILCSGICGSQLGEIAGVKGKDPYLPHLLGHEATAEVYRLGPGVRHVKEGDRVVLHWRKGLGIEARPPQYIWKGKPLQAGAVTTFQPFAIVSENRMTPVSSTYDPEVLALFGCAIPTGFGVIVHNARLSIGESVVVFGAGGVGLNMIQAAKLVSAYPIIAVDRVASRLSLAERMGATHTILSTQVDPQQQLSYLLPEGCDCFIDNTGHPEVIQLGYRYTKPQGRVVLVGVPAWDQQVSLHTLPLHFGKVLIGSHGGESQPHEDIPRYLQLVQAGILDFTPLITHRFALHQINEALDAMRNGTCQGRCIVDMGHLT